MELGVVIVKLLDGVHEDGPSAYGQKLLGEVASHARSLASSHNDDMVHGFGLVLLRSVLSLGSHQVGVHHAVLHGAHLILADEIAQYAVGVRQAGGRSFASNDVAVFLEELCGVSGAREVFLETGPEW